MQCNYGTIGRIYDYGINKSRDVATTCSTNDVNRSCKPDGARVVDTLNSSIGEISFNLDFNGSDLYKN